MSGAWAVIVTRDRLALLEQCIAALRAQTRRPDRILVVDNASSDGTSAWVSAQEDLDVLRLDHNAGGAGGFHAGLEHAHARGAEWAWLMDDDTIPRPEALEALLRLDDPATILRASVAVWKDGRLHPMNVPGLERERVEPLIDAAPHRVLPLRTSTFVSLLVHRSAVDRFGLPEARYFIWSDDIEYTARVTRGGGRMVLVTDSVVEHRTDKPYTAVTSAGDRFYYHARNTLYMVRGRSWSVLEKASLLYLLALTSLQYVRAGGSARVVLRGLRDGVR
ncbi:MAG TPA: glycosyltransferase [Solirubrobacteraceae bacterium]|nr:glycosyltransferase [Solirubrobacteraceae bacterium]